jgi:RNA polymerase sigma factor (TIGR02999 family)
VEDHTDFTRTLHEATDGDARAADRLAETVYSELRRLAAQHLRKERPEHTLQATALVHEAYLRLVGQSRVEWCSRAHFLGMASEMIRRILVDHARHRNRLKRDGGRRPVDLAQLPEIAGGDDESPVDLLALDETLEELDRVNQRHRRVVELRFFGGLSVKDTAEVLGVSPETVKLDWRTARAWLHARLKEIDDS